MIRTILGLASLGIYFFYRNTNYFYDEDAKHIKTFAYIIGIFANIIPSTSFFVFIAIFFFFLTKSDYLKDITLSFLRGYGTGFLLFFAVAILFSSVLLPIIAR